MIRKFDITQLSVQMLRTIFEHGTRRQDKDRSDGGQKPQAGDFIRE